MRVMLKNEQLTVEIESFGAELKSVKSAKDNREYMWCADEKYWKRTSPVLFPLVGSLKGQSYQYEGKTYPMSQHGFARDKEFTMILKSEDKVVFQLKADADTLKVYPFDFVLEIGYELSGNSLTVLWKVINGEEEKEMYFSIGAHPAFNCPMYGEDSKTGYGMKLNTKSNVLYSRINKDGLMLNSKSELKLHDGLGVFTEDFFDEGVYIIEDYQASEVSLVDPDGKPYVTVSFDAPLFGIWTPEKKNAPFVCIEPWYGRCDRESFAGDLNEREWGQKLSPKESFEKKYKISFSQRKSIIPRDNLIK